MAIHIRVRLEGVCDQTALILEILFGRDTLREDVSWESVEGVTERLVGEGVGSGNSLGWLRVETMIGRTYAIRICFGL